MTKKSDSLLKVNRSNNGIINDGGFEEVGVEEEVEETNSDIIVGKKL